MGNWNYWKRRNEVVREWLQKCEQNAPKECAYCLGVEPKCRLVPTDDGLMHSKCAAEAGVTVQYSDMEIDHHA